MSPPDPPAPARTSSPEQKRAAHALRTVNAVAALDDAMIKKAYRSYVERVGTMIITNGLGQALATELAAAGGSDSAAPEKSAHRRLYDNLQSWLCDESGVLRGVDLLATIVAIPQADYLRAQTEALAWLVWHKKLCRAFLPRGQAA